jgi:hypothetical protein
MIYVESPKEFNFDNKKDHVSFFLAGGITDCPDWQQEIRGLLKDEKVILVNPRRKHWDMSGGDEASRKQITWEYNNLRAVDMILFWFPKETMCPIVLLELGSWLVKRETPIFVGVHPKYERKLDVETQTKLARPNVEIVDSLEDLAEQVKKSHPLFGAFSFTTPGNK